MVLSYLADDYERPSGAAVCRQHRHRLGTKIGVLVIDLDMKIGKPRGIDSIFDLMDEYEPLPLVHRRV
jgi:hypothetical protein